jgi:hypothetical protein
VTHCAAVDSTVQALNYLHEGFSAEMPAACSRSWKLEPQRGVAPLPILLWDLRLQRLNADARRLQLFSKNARDLRRAGRVRVDAQCLRSDRKLFPVDGDVSCDGHMPTARVSIDPWRQPARVFDAHRQGVAGIQQPIAVRASQVHDDSRD